MGQKFHGSIYVLSLHRADHSFREALPTVMCCYVESINLKNEEAVSCIGPQCHRKKNCMLCTLLNEYEIIFERCETLNCTTFCMKGQRISIAGVP